jgi:hypothetical protein
LSVNPIKARNQRLAVFAASLTDFSVSARVPLSVLSVFQRTSTLPAVAMAKREVNSTSHAVYRAIGSCCPSDHHLRDALSLERAARATF